MNHKIRVVVVGCGNMGSSHARAYKMLEGFELVGLVARSPKRRTPLAEELGGIAQFDNLDEAIAQTRPHAVAICTYSDTHYEFATKCLNNGLHLFLEKPLAETVAQAEKIVALATEKRKKVVVGYILRHHPSWMKFIELVWTLGKPLVMRISLNQQSKGVKWEMHKQLMNSLPPIVECGVHYVDIMCQMTRSRPVRVQAIGAHMSDEITPGVYNYGQLQVVFDDSSVGWYEVGWGPMMSKTASFVRDVIGPKGCVSIVDSKNIGEIRSSDIEAYTKTNSLLIHEAEMDAMGNFVRQDVHIDTRDEPNLQELCNREQAYFLKAIQDDLDLHDHLQDAVNSLRIVLAADESVRTGCVVSL